MKTHFFWLTGIIIYLEFKPVFASFPAIVGGPAVLVFLLLLTSLFLHATIPMLSLASLLLLAFLSLHASLLLLASYCSRIQIRILGSVPLTYRFGSGPRSSLFRQWLASCQRKIRFFQSFFAFYFLKVHLHESSTTTNSRNQVEGWWKDPDPDPRGPKHSDPQHCFLHSIRVRKKECLKVWKAQFLESEIFLFLSWNFVPL
jgi:hypothetical protein